MRKGLTMMELLIIIGLIIILAFFAIMFLNPVEQIKKAKDSKRKADLSTLKKALEEWYDDKNYYPRPEEICYDSQPGSLICHICGDKPNSPHLQPYINKLPCDPDSLNNQNYLYEVNNLNQPTLYRIYANLSFRDDPSILASGCLKGCSPGGENFEKPCSFNYGISSPNNNLTQCAGNVFCRNINRLYCKDNLGMCNICNNYNRCKQICAIKEFYINSNCQITCIKD